MNNEERLIDEFRKIQNTLDTPLEEWEVKVILNFIINYINLFLSEFEGMVLEHYITNSIKRDKLNDTQEGFNLALQEVIGLFKEIKKSYGVK